MSPCSPAISLLRHLARDRKNERFFSRERA